MAGLFALMGQRDELNCALGSDNGGDWGGNGKQLTKCDYAIMRLVLLTLTLTGIVMIALAMWID